MTAVPDFVREELRRRRERRGPIWNGAALTALFVGAGYVAASMSLSPVPTPGNVARAYVEARFDRDWAVAWELMCERAQLAHRDFRTFAKASEFDFHLMPRDVNVSAGRPHTIEMSRPAIAVPMTVESTDLYFKNWETGGDMVLVEEDGHLRVCAGSAP